MNSIPIIPNIDILLRSFSAPTHSEWLLLCFYSPYKYIFMTDSELEVMPVLRKASRCATLYELLCEELELEPLSPNTTWKEIAKSYSITMEAGFKAQNSTTLETAKD